jgi:DNA-binding CsgD family transcriptional regulator
MLDHPGFLCDADYLTTDDLADDPVHALFNRAGLGWQIGSLARSGLIAARLRLTAATAAVSAFRAMALPAAVLSAGGKVLVANDLMEREDEIRVANAFGRMTVRDQRANQLLSEAIEAALRHDVKGVCSVPIPSTEGQSARVLHVVPLMRTTSDIFSGGDILVVMTGLAAGENSPSPKLLAGLFDLTPSEARVVAILEAGGSTTDASLELGITPKSARTYLDRVFAKTGTNGQAQLVALVRSVAPFGPGNEADATSATPLAADPLFDG